MHVSADHITQLETALAAADPLILLPPLHPRYIQSLLARWVERRPTAREVRLVEPFRGSRNVLPDRVDPGTGRDKGMDLGQWLDEAELPMGGDDHWQRVWWIPDLSESWGDARTAGILSSVCRELATRDLRLRILLRAPTMELPTALKTWTRTVELLAPKAEEADAQSFALRVLRRSLTHHSPGSIELDDLLQQLQRDGIAAHAELSMLLQGLDAAAVNIVIEAVARWLVTRSMGTRSVDWPTLRARFEKEREGQLKQASGLTIERKSDETLEGMPRFQRYLEYVSVLFHDHRFERKVGGPTPRGVLLVGLPGCGKSLAARVAAEKLDVPLLRMDVGAMMGRYLGESEANLRRALDAAEAAAPCVLWVDELEKALGGMGKEGEGGGTGKRMLGQLLTWMQSHKSSVYLFATANAVKGLPPELLRRGRFDELWRVMLPEDDEREAILRSKLHELQSECEPALLETESPLLAELVKSTKGYTGADIGSLVREAWMRARVFEKKVTMERIREVQAGDFEPMSAQFSSEIKESIAELKQHGFRNVWCAPDKLDPAPPSDRMGKNGRLRGELAEIWRTEERILAVFQSEAGAVLSLAVEPGEGSTRRAHAARDARSWAEWNEASPQSILLQRDGRSVAVQGLTPEGEGEPAKLSWEGEDPGRLQLTLAGEVYGLISELQPESVFGAVLLPPPLDRLWTASEPMMFAVSSGSSRQVFVVVVQPATEGTPRPATLHIGTGRAALYPRPTSITLCPKDGQLVIDGMSKHGFLNLKLSVYASLQGRDGKVVLAADGMVYSQLMAVQTVAAFEGRGAPPSAHAPGYQPPTQSMKTTASGMPFFKWQGKRYTVAYDVQKQAILVRGPWGGGLTMGKVKSAAGSFTIQTTDAKSKTGSLTGHILQWSAAVGTQTPERLLVRKAPANAKPRWPEFGGNWASLHRAVSAGR